MSKPSNESDVHYQRLRDDLDRLKEELRTVRDSYSFTLTTLLQLRDELREVDLPELSVAMRRLETRMRKHLLDHDS